MEPTTFVKNALRKKRTPMNDIDQCLTMTPDLLVEYTFKFGMTLVAVIMLFIVFLVFAGLIFKILAD